LEHESPDHYNGTPIVKMSKPQRFLLFVFPLTIVGVSVAMTTTNDNRPAFNSDRNDTSPGGRVAAGPSPEQFDAAAFLKPHLDAATKRTADSLDIRIGEVRLFFDAAQQRTAGFAKTALSLSSKWAMLVDAAPFNDSGRQAAFLKTEFERQVFSPDDLTKAIEQAIVGFTADLASIENQMLVDIRADLNAQGIVSVVRSFDDELFRETFRKILARCKRDAAIDTAGDVAIFATSIVIERIVVKVLFSAARKTGTSAAVLGAGAATSWASLGTSMIAAIIIDQILSKIWDWAFDPVGKLQANLNDHLQKLCDSVCGGREDRTGLRSHFEHLAAERNHYRELVLPELLNCQGH